MAASNAIRPLTVIYGPDVFQRARQREAVLHELLPPDCDRTMALVEYDGEKPPEEGGPQWGTVMDDLATLPFLADRRVVLIRAAGSFISLYRPKLEVYLSKPFQRSALVLDTALFPASKLTKMLAATPGALRECKALARGAVLEFIFAEGARRQKRLDHDAAERLVDHVGGDSGLLASEVEKLAIYAADRPTITGDDVAALCGKSREEKIFAVMEAAGLGRPRVAFEQWRMAIALDRSVPFKAAGGMAFVARRWIAAHRTLASGGSMNSVAGGLFMWKREREAEQLLRRVPLRRSLRLLAAIAELEWQVRRGTRTIEAGVERLLAGLAGA